jgi:hypothetical protein
MSGADSYRNELDALLDGLDLRANQDEQIQRWADFFAEQGYGEDEVSTIVIEAVTKRIGKKDAEGFAERVRKRFLWHPSRQKR